MKIAIISVAKPETGTGNGTTEYAYQLMLRLREKKGNKVDSYYAVDKSRKNDIAGLIYTNTLFSRQIAAIAKKNYDIIHITIQELGFAARILKKKKTTARIVTTVHDLIRLKKNMHKGVLQTSYNRLVKRSFDDAIRYSDFITFNSRQTMEETFSHYGTIKNSALAWHGTKRSFIDEPIRKLRHNKFVVGYIGALGQYKNVISILKIAERLKDSNHIIFKIYGTGEEKKRIEDYKEKQQLMNVYMMGFISEDKLIRTYDSFDAFMMPSMYEGLSHQVLEAGARGVPIIIYKKAKIPEEIAKHCIKAKDEKDAAAILERISKTGVSKKQTQSITSYYRKFTWDRTADQIYAIYKKLL